LDLSVGGSTPSTPARNEENMSIRKGSDVVIIDMEDAKKIVEGYRLLVVDRKAMAKLAEAECLCAFDDLVTIVKDKEAE
jgi:hypothetical protein